MVESKTPISNALVRSPVIRIAIRTVNTNAAARQVMALTHVLNRVSIGWWKRKSVIKLPSIVKHQIQ
jgi:hypothetical protein